MTDESLGRKQLVGEALQALQQMRLGVANRIFGGNGHIRFTIVMNRAECATETRLKRMTEILERSGFRAILSRISDATLAVDCVRSRRESTVVQRVGRDEKSQGSHLVLGHGKGKILFVCDSRASDRRIVLLTQKDDQVEIWRDHDDDDKPSPHVSEFRNPAISAFL